MSFTPPLPLPRCESHLSTCWVAALRDGCHLPRWTRGLGACPPPGAAERGAAATPGLCVSGLLALLRLFKLKKRYRNVLDTMFELLPRMARYCLPRGPRARRPEACAPWGWTAGRSAGERRSP